MNANDLNAYLDAVLGDTEGYLHTATGIGPCFNEAGKYKHRVWAPKHYRWPEQRRQAVADMRAAADDCDVYACPYPMRGNKRAKGEAAARRIVHADFDSGQLDIERARSIGGFAVGSGSPGHAHVYVALAEAVSGEWHQKLCRGLGAYLGGADAKITDNDVLRPPGTLNHKRRAAGKGDPTPVEWLVRPDGTEWEPHDLAAMLGVTLSEQIDAAPQPTLGDTMPAQSTPICTTAEPVELAGYPTVAAALADNTGDRSADTMRVVGACHDAGLTLAQTRSVVASRTDLAQRLADRHDDDVMNCWDKATASRQASVEVTTVEELAAGSAEAIDPVEAAIRNRLTSLRINREAQRRLDEEQRPKLELPPLKSLTVLLAEPDEDTPWLIDKVMQADSRVMLAAQFKSGKTTTTCNLVRSLADGDPFLGAFTINQAPWRITIIDDELSERMLRGWLRDQNVKNTDAVADVVSLHGRVGSFNILDEHTRALWVDRLTSVGCNFLILDCLRPILDALGLDENRDAGKFLTAFDALLAEAGITNAVMVDHMGHSGERNRGDSRKLDWPDATWKLVRETDKPDSARYFSAYGRDVDLWEGRLGFDPVTRHLTYVAGSRTDSKVRAAYIDVVRLLACCAKGDDQAGTPNAAGMTKNGIENELRGAGYGENTENSGHSQKAIRAAIAHGTETGVLRILKGATHNSKPVVIAYPCRECGLPVTSKRERHESCPADAVEVLPE